MKHDCNNPLTINKRSIKNLEKQNILFFCLTCGKIEFTKFATDLDKEKFEGTNLYYLKQIHDEQDLERQKLWDQAHK